LSRNGKPSLLISPNSVLANALLRSIDILRPRVLATRPSRIEFVVGTQINGAPHLGTNLVQTAAFSELIAGYYQAFFTSLSQATDTDYEVETYTDQQATPGFRAEFLRTLERLEDFRWWMAPSHGVVHVRVPCPDCGWAEKRADRTKLAHLDEDGATFTAVCFDHGTYEAHIDPEDDQPYLDLATLYRNLVKERALGRDPSTLHVMMKGGDWAFGCQLVDGALGALNTPPTHMPIRVFTPQVLAPTGAKLSKSLLRGQGKGALPADVEPWMLDTTAWPGSIDQLRRLTGLDGQRAADRPQALLPLVHRQGTRPHHDRTPHRTRRPRPRDGHLQTLLRPHRHRPQDHRDPRQRLQPPQDQGRLADPVPMPRRPSPHPCHPRRPLRHVRRDVRPRRSRLGQPAGHPRRATREHPPDLPPPREREALGVVALGIELVDPPRTT